MIWVVSPDEVRRHSLDAQRAEVERLSRLKARWRRFATVCWLALLLLSVAALLVEFSRSVAGGLR